jgi:nitrogen-specific signal transduction histidine kinase
MYIVTYLSQNTDGSKKILVVSRYRQPKANAYTDGHILISLTGENAKVDDEELEKLFDPFDAEHHTLVDIGPSVSQKIIEEHDGSLDFHLEKKGELTFEVTLPVGV